MHDGASVINDGNGTGIRTYSIPHLWCNSVTSVWGGKIPDIKKVFFSFPVVLKHLVLLAGLSISRTWPFHYGCHLCNNRPHPGEGQLGFSLFHAWQCLQVVLAVLLRLTSNPNGCSTGIILIFSWNLYSSFPYNETHLLSKQAITTCPTRVTSPPPL